jgi:5-methylthioribose kinase
MAQVKDVTRIADEDKRAWAERVNILCAKDCIMNRGRFLAGKDYLDALDRAAQKA